MILTKRTTFPWEGVVVRCTNCDAEFALEHDDIKRPGFKPYRAEGRWWARTSCDECARSMVVFSEVVDDPARTVE